MDYVVNIVRRPVWGMLYADGAACTISQSPQGLAKMMEVVVEVCRAFALTVSEKKTETMCIPPPPRTTRTMVRVKAAGQTCYKQVESFTYLGGAVSKTPDDMSVGIARWTRACWMRIGRYLRGSTTIATESNALPQDPNGKGRGNRGPPVWMQYYVDPPPRTLRQTPHRTPPGPGLASHHRDTEQETSSKLRCNPSFPCLLCLCNNLAWQLMILFKLV